MQGLSLEEISTFHSQGYLILPNVYDHRTLQALRDSITAQLDTECHRLIKNQLISDENALPDSQYPEREIRDGPAFADLRFRYAKHHLHPGRGWTHLEQGEKTWLL